MQGARAPHAPGAFGVAAPIPTPLSILQAIEDPRAACVIDVQWHPEYLPRKGEQRALFRRLVAAAADRATAPVEYNSD